MSETTSPNDLTLRKLLIGLSIASAGFAILDLVYEKHPHVSFEGWFNFYGFFSVLATLVIVGIAVLARNVLERKEDYYDG